MADNKPSSRVPITLRDLFWQDPFFSTNWEDFHKLHDEMMQETRSMWQKFDDRMKQLEASGGPLSPTLPPTPMLDQEVRGAPAWPFPKRLMRLPSIFNEETSKDMFKVMVDT